MSGGSSGTGRRRTVFAGALVGLALLGDSFLYAALPVHHREAGIGLLTVGWMLSLNRWVRLLTNPLAGRMGAAMGWGKALCLAMWLAAAATLGYGCVRPAVLLLLLRALWGLAWSLLRLAGQAAVLVESPPGRRAHGMGLFTGVYRLGSLAGMVVGGYLADRWGLRPAAVALAGVTALGAVAGSLPPAVGGRWGAPARPDAPAGGTPARGPAAAWVPRGAREWAVCGLAATVYMATSGVVTSTVGHLVATRAGPPVALGPWVLGAGAVSGTLLSSRWVIDFLLGPVLGRWADRWGCPFLGAGVALIASMLVVLSGARGLPAVGLALVVLFAANTGCAAALDGWASDLAGRTPGRFLPLYATWVDAGAAAGPLLAYYLVDLAGLAAAYRLTAVLVVAGAAGGWLLSRAARGGADGSGGRGGPGEGP